MNPEPDTDIDRLYVAPRDQFIPERNALAKRLRAAGDKDAAAEIAALRKPTLVAWIVNQLAHNDRRDIDLLLDAGKRIVDAQQASITSGGRAELDTAQRTLRQAVGTLTRSTATITGTTPTQTTLTRVAETLRTAATHPDGRELLARGHLTEELNETGWEIVAGLSPSPRSKPSKNSKHSQADKPHTTPAPAPSHAKEIRAETKRLRDLDRSRTAAEKRQRSAHDEEQKAVKHLLEIQEARADADAELEAIQRDISSTEERLSGLRGQEPEGDASL